MPSEIAPNARTLADHTVARGLVAEGRTDESPQRHIAERVGDSPQDVADAEEHELERFGSAVGTENSSVVRTTTGSAENRMKGRILPQRVWVRSMIVPTTGSVTASIALAPARIAETMKIPCTLMCANCTR